MRQSFQWIKIVRVGAWLMLLTLSVAIGMEQALADVTPARDGTGTRTRRNGNQTDIEGGRLSGDGHNLFHSFERFGLSANEVANFLSNPEIRNILGRVTGGDPSVINGLIRVSGGNSNLFLMNPAGIVFGRNARLDVPGSFTATTANGIGFGNNLWFNAIGSSDYQALVGNPNGFAFTMSQPGAIVNAGDLSVSAGQAINFFGGTIVNTGTLSTAGGQVRLTAVPGENMVRLSQEGMILQLEIPTAGETLPNGLPFNPLALPQLLTVGAEADSGLTVNPDNSVQLTNSGTVIPTQTGTTIASGAINTSSSETGGTVDLLGDRVGLVSATIDASGDNGGGTVHVGGDYQGQRTLPRSDRTSVSRDSLIDVDAIRSGNGGRAIVWSDGTTSFDGNISAQGGATGGNGGFAEISGRNHLDFQGLADLRTFRGVRGTLLLDPTNITISEAPTPTGSFLLSRVLQNQLAMGNVAITTTTPSGAIDPGELGDITVNAPINLGSSNLTLRADRSITVNQNIRSTSGNITLRANTARASAGNLTGVTVNNAIISSRGGDINIIGTVNGTRNGDDDINNGINIDRGTLRTTGTGNITLRGTNNTDGNGHGIRLSNSTIVATDIGRITLDGDSSNIRNGEGILSEEKNSINGGDGKITIKADSLNFSGNTRIEGTGVLQVREHTPNLRITLGAGASAGNLTPGLNINVQDFVNIHGFSQIIIGQNGNITFNVPSNLPANLRIFHVPAPLTFRAATISQTGNDLRLDGSFPITFRARQINLGNVFNPGQAINLTTNGGDITTGVLDTRLLNGKGALVRNGNGGAINLTANGGDVQVASIQTQGGRSGGDVNITSTDRFFRATNGDRASISTAGGQRGGDITIRHGGRGITAFNVGNLNETNNGTNAAITTGASTISPDRSFLFTHTQDNIRIISVPPPVNPDDQTPSPIQPIAPATRENLPPSQMAIGLLNGSDKPVDFSSLEVSASSDYEQYLGLSPKEVRIRTLSEAQQQLQEVERNAGIKPALIYVFFTPPGSVSDQAAIDDPQNNQLQLDDNLLELELVLVVAHEAPVRVRMQGVTRQQVTEMVSRFREAASNSATDPESYLRPSEQLYTWLIAPLKAKLEEQKIDTIAFVMDSGLRTLPIAALSDPGSDPNSFADNHYLVERYNLGLMPSLSLTQADFKGVKDSRVLALGTANFEEKYRLPNLPAVPVELSDIAGLWSGTRVLPDQEFTTARLRTEQRSNPSGIIHIATHALIEGSLDSSVIVFSDKALPFSQFRSLNLGGTELLVLSACNTATENREAELGFAGLAVQAGVKSVLGSLWRVSDEGTLALMTEFYRQLHNAPIKANALRQAQIRMLHPIQVQQGTSSESSTSSTEELSHPAFWAAFTVIGSPW